ncbi:TetR/AcrR family transcriptional regulator [Bacillus sinesaloumensis]|uniref:TetR/AcrR family transcriptional regulator n=1 Tax=Litchfieldia sinesaloumensis TaxID=1926280 RepID=UPI0009888B28|nr:TetR/AcrR family transcriptional regulator [Bacillus sinesaloumensis]
MARERKFTKEELYRVTEELLLTYNYEGFQISLVADHLNVSRGAIYKYYENKEELITEYMLFKMEQFLQELEEINNIIGFQSKFDFLMTIMFKNPELYQLIEIGKSVPIHINVKVKEGIEKLDGYRIEMYEYAHSFIEAGKSEKLLNPKIPDSVMLGYIFQSVVIPNHFNIPHDVWVQSIKDLICHGIFIDS